jgi:hypothetical protein
MDRPRVVTPTRRVGYAAAAGLGMYLLGGSRTEIVLAAIGLYAFAQLETWLAHLYRALTEPAARP